jgi:hypothetical protein
MTDDDDELMSIILLVTITCDKCLAKMRKMFISLFLLFQCF